MLKKSYFLIATFSLNSALAAGLTLEEAIEAGLKESPAIKLSLAREDEFSAKKSGAMAGFLPHLGLQANKFVEQKYQTFSMSLGGGTAATIPLVSPKTIVDLNFRMPIFNGLRNYNSYKAASFLSESASLQQNWEEFSLKRKIKEAFYRALAAEQFARVAQENIVTLEDHLAHVEARKKGGLTTNYDVLRIEVQLDEAKTQKMEADDRVILARKELARVMGLPNDDRELVGDLPVPSDNEQLKHLTVDESLKRSDIESLRLLEKAADHNKRSAGSWLFPEIGLMANYDWYNNVNYSWTRGSEYKNAYGGGVYLTWNLYDGGASHASSKEKVAQLRQSEAQLKLEEQRLPIALETFQRRYRYGLALYRTTVSDIKKSEESVRQAKEGARQGVRTVSEQLDAQLDLFRSRAGKVNAQLITAEALINLELVTGKELEQ